MSKEYKEDQLLILQHLNKVNGPCSILDLRTVVPVWADTILQRLAHQEMIAKGFTHGESWAITHKGQMFLLG